jgi:hypothetical protein
MRRLILAATACALCALLASCDFTGIERFGKSRALVFGVADYLYLDPPQDLTLTVLDAQKVHSVLYDSGYDASLFTEAAASKASIMTAIASLDASHENLVFYFSGHGDRIGATSYIIPYDGLFDDQTNHVVPASSISLEELRGWIESTGIGMYTVILDTCFSGGFVAQSGVVDLWPDNYGYSITSPSGSQIEPALGAALRELPLLMGASLTRGSPSRGLWVSAAGSAEGSYESPSTQHGIFSYYFFFMDSDPLERQRALDAADANKDGHIGASEAFARAVRSISEEWNANELHWDWRTQTYSDTPFLPHESGLPYDHLLFKAH